MSDLFWAGDERAGALFEAKSLVAALTAVEWAWLEALVRAGIAPADAALPGPERPDLSDPGDVELIARGAEAGGNPVIGLVRLLRARVEPLNPTAAQWLHQGLTSQDVLDTALISCAASVLDRLRQEFTGQIRSLRQLSDTHRHTLMAGRTLTQFAVPITFGLKAAVWLQGILDAAESAREVRLGLRSQFGGAAGTMAATVELADRAGLSEPARRVEDVVAEASRLLALTVAPPWHTTRAPITRIGDALVGCTDAWGHVATDVITLSRPEIAELAEPAGEGRGVSSTMPQKRNPVLSVLIRRSALSAPMLGAQLHLAAADAGDERPAGAWHTEWAALRTLARATVVAADQTTELLAGLQVDPARMLATVQAASPGILAERLKPGPSRFGTPAQSADTILGRAWDEVLDDLVPDTGGGGTDRRLDPRGYLGTNELTIDATLARAEKFLLLEAE
jgi:3-carboxy-cis,cis-muconate cycloisomerase